MNELGKRDLFYIIVFAVLIAVLTIIIFIELGGHTCNEFDPVEACSALSDMA